MLTLIRVGFLGISFGVWGGEGLKLPTSPLPLSSSL